MQKLRLCIFLFILGMFQFLLAGEFGAYYSKINSGQEFEKYSRTGDYADIIVDLGQNSGKFIFWRGSSYLPYFKVDGKKYFVEEVVPRDGDGPDMRPDRANMYARAKIIKSTPEKVVVHWRYLPQFGGTNPHTGVSQTEFVDEYFYVYPDRSVKRTIKKGTQRIDDWRDPGNHITKKIKLTNSGIKEIGMKPAEKTLEPEQVKGSPKIDGTVLEPVAWWRFDEGKGNTTAEQKSGTRREVAGHKTLWRQGVSGTALQFDGYTSKINLPDKQSPEPKDALTIESWISIGAYPWSYVPIVQQIEGVPEELISTKGQEAVLHGEEGRDKMVLEKMSDFDFVLKKEDETGYFFGLDGYGRPVFKLRVGGEWEELTADFHMERRTWYHLAATYDKKTGLMKIFLNGKPIEQKKVARSNIELAKKDLKIGQGKERRPIRPVRMNTFKDNYSFDGLIDEIKIYDKALSAQQINETYHLYGTNRGRYALVDMDERDLPSGKEKNHFGGYYTHMDFYDVWDNQWRFSDHPDVVVEFDENPSKFVFWRGTCYIPMIVNEKGQWYSNEFNETWNKSGGDGCQEPMSDKESYHNYARILENTPARVVVHYRFPLIDVKHVMANYDPETGWCDISDWYFYIYPDGIAVKKMHLWTHGERNHEWQESMAIFGPNQHPEQIIETEGAVTMMGLDGDYEVYDWINGPPAKVDKPKDQKIQYIDYTGEYDPVTVGDFQWSDVYAGEITPYAVFPTWNHWPVSQMPSDGRYALFPDRTAHSSLTHVGPSIYDEQNGGPKPYYQKILMEGMLKTDKEEIVKIANSWMNAPKITDLNGARGKYDPAQRAYVLEKNNKKIDFTLDCSKESPLHNTGIVIKKWKMDKPAKVFVDGNTMENCEKLKQGIKRDTDGSKTLIIWLEKESVKPVDIEIVAE